MLLIRKLRLKPEVLTAGIVRKKIMKGGKEAFGMRKNIYKIWRRRKL
jgi:hypothetical protein